MLNLKLQHFSELLRLMNFAKDENTHQKDEAAQLGKINLLKTTKKAESDDKLFKFVNKEHLITAFIQLANHIVSEHKTTLFDTGF